MKYFIFTIILLGQVSFAQPGTVSEEEVGIQKVFLEGKGEMIQGNIEKAITIFEQVLEKDRNNAASAYELSRIYDLQEVNDKALKYAIKAVEWDNRNTWYHQLLADLYQKNNSDDKAAEVYEKLIELYPEEDDYYFKRAYYLVRAGEPDKAIKVYETLEEQMGINEEITRRKHSLYLGMGNYKKAEKELLILTETYPKNTSYLHALANFYNQIGEVGKEKATFQAILNIDPKDPQANIALTDTGKNKNDSAYFNKLASVFKNPNIHIDVKITELMPMVAKVAQTEDAELANELLPLAYILEEVHSNEAKSYSVTGDLLYYSGKKEEALERYKKTIENDENVYLVWEQMLYIYAELEDYDNLLKESENALDLFPNQGAINYLNGLAYSGNKEHKNAVSALQQALIMSGKNQQLKFQIYGLLGAEYAELKQFERSNKNFEEALKLNPNAPLVLNNYAFQLSERNQDLNKAKEMSALANELFADQSIFQDTYAWVLYKMKDYKGAKKWMEQAIGNGGNEDPVILEHYGDILFQSGDTEQAIINWQKALEKGSESLMLEKKIAEKKLFE